MESKGSESDETLRKGKIRHAGVLTLRRPATRMRPEGGAANK